MRKMLFQKKCLLLTLTVFLGSWLLTVGCKSKGYDSPENYTINKPYRYGLGKALTEISGICFIQKDSTLLAISDSKERVYAIHLKTNKLIDYTSKLLPPNSDIEDIVKVDTSLFLLMSKGTIVEIRDKATDTAGIKMYDLGLPGTNDFETLYYDPTKGVDGLVMICKTCAHEKGTNVRTAYRFSLATKTFDSTVFFTIDKEEIKALLKNDKTKFDPSAAAIHPINKRLYILSSASHMLVIADTRGKVIEAYHLHPEYFPQAEGIAFAPDGDMYI
ncbi:MAG: SdiA-regulated domain-containing protein, partial [Bacteroidota bacterium]|nr:SdiA-regulated domain-containing protein [Bacteroidota bacterium]